MKFDDVLTVLGDFGRYQKVVFVALCLPIVLVGMQILSPVFTLATPKHRLVSVWMHTVANKVESLYMHYRCIDNGSKNELVRQGNATITSHRRNHDTTCADAEGRPKVWTPPPSPKITKI